MRGSVWATAADDGALVDDLARELAARFDWGIYNVNVVPEASLPFEGEQGEVRLEPGALVIVTDPNQGAPSFEQGSPEPGGETEIRIRFEQPITSDLADRGLLLSRRQDLRREFSRLHGAIG